MQLLCQRNSLNLRSFIVQEIAELSEILTVQQNTGGSARSESLVQKQRTSRKSVLGSRTVSACPYRMVRKHWRSPENVGSVHGRGIYLMKAFMDEVRFEEGGVAVHRLEAHGTLTAHSQEPANWAPPARRQS